MTKYSKCAALMLVLGSAFVADSFAAPSAEAAIRCNGRFQISGGREISTPYCEDEYLARVAREYGARVSGRRLRRDFGKKREICRLVGFDSRVLDICSGLRNENRRGRFFFN